MPKAKALFLDLDGTVRGTIGDKPCPNRPEEQKVLPNVERGLKDYKSHGYKIVAVTNQGGIGMGYMTEKQCLDCLRDLNNRLGNIFDKMYYAPARPDAKHPLTKPNPGMLLKARDELDLDLSQSLMVGDRDTDKQAAEKAGVKFVWAEDFFSDK